MSRYSATYVRASSGVRSGHAWRRMSLSARPVIAPTRSKSSAVPPCAAMTRLAVSTTKRTLSVSVPSRSQRTARMRGRVSAAARRAGGRGFGIDRQRDLLGQLPVARLLAPPKQQLELVVERLGVLQAGVDDLEAQVAHRVMLRQALEDHLTDALRRDLGCAALPDRRLDVVDEPVGGVSAQRLRRALADRRDELAAIELLFRPVALDDLDARRLGPLACREALAAFLALAPTPNGLAILGLARVDDRRVRVTTIWAAHDHTIWEGRPLHLVAPGGCARGSSGIPRRGRRCSAGR